jgi:methylenetetrahydrofolate dehydrogenase (NADP+)/methenyltetrahydrofolate cyclohydrolase
MTAQILDGNAIAASLRADIRQRVEALAAEGRRVPGLAVVLVGSDPASRIYVRGKRRDCQEVGYHSETHELPEDTTQATLLELVARLNADPRIDGFLVQEPLPKHIDPDVIIDHIDPLKDIDGFHPYNIGRLALRRPALRSCTPKGIMHLLAHPGLRIRGMNATVVGASNHVGRPMALELLLAGCTVTSAHRFTRDLPGQLREADIVVSATGVPRLVKGDWIKPGAIVIDVGITREGDRLMGDVEFDVAVQRAAWITPVPGGVGPMTRAALLDNTLNAYLTRSAWQGEARGA